MIFRKSIGVVLRGSRTGLGQGLGKLGGGSLRVCSFERNNSKFRFEFVSGFVFNRKLTN